MNMTLICSVCNKEENFMDEKAAFMDGWDILGINMNENKVVCTCGDCPSGPIMIDVIKNEKKS